MAKSLEELRLAFKAQYPKEADDKQEEPVELESQDDIKESQDEGQAVDADERSEEPEPIESTTESIESPEAAESVEELEEAEEPIGEPESPELTEALELIDQIETTKEYTIDTTIVDEIQRQKATEAEKDKSKSAKEKTDEIEKTNEKLKTAQQELEAEIAALKEKKQKKASIISDFIFYSTLILMVVLALLFSRGAFGNQVFGGLRFYEVLTTSMDSVYPRGSLILIKEVDTNELVVGDDITFTKDSSDLITHRIIEIKENHEGSGKRAFVTKGVDNAAPDADMVLADNVVGRVARGFRGLGATLTWIGNNLWIVLVLFLSLMALSFFLKMFWREQEKLRKGKDKEKQTKTDIIRRNKE